MSTVVRVIAVLALIMTAGCRWHFGDVGRGDDAVTPDPDAGFVVDDSGQLVSCAVDTDCGRCQRCESNYCQRATFTQLDIAQFNSCALDERGQLWCWGRNDYLNVDPELSGLEVVPRPRRRTTLASRFDQLAMAWGLKYMRTDTGALIGEGVIGGDAQDPGPGWVALYGAHFNACARKTDGTLHCAGSNDYAQLGDGMTAAVQGITQFGTDSDWAVIGPGESACAIKQNGTLWCVGRNQVGQLGRGTTSAFSATIAQVGVDTDWASVGTGDGHVCAIKTNGTLWCWGEDFSTGAIINTPDQIDTETGWSKLEVYYRCAAAWRGGIAYWTCADGPQAMALEGVRTFAWRPMAVQPDADTEIRIGGEHACMQRNGAWQCWGNNTFGAAGVDELAVVAPTPLCE